MPFKFTRPFVAFVAFATLGAAAVHAEEERASIGQGWRCVDETAAKEFIAIEHDFDRPGAECSKPPISEHCLRQRERNRDGFERERAIRKKLGGRCDISRYRAIILGNSSLPGWVRVRTVGNGAPQEGVARAETLKLEAPLEKAPVISTDVRAAENEVRANPDPKTYEAYRVTLTRIGALACSGWSTVPKTDTGTAPRGCEYLKREHSVHSVGVSSEVPGWVSVTLEGDNSRIIRNEDLKHRTIFCAQAVLGVNPLTGAAMGPHLCRAGISKLGVPESAVYPYTKY